MTRAGPADLMMVHDGGRRTPLARLLTADGADVIMFHLNMSDVAAAVSAVRDCLYAYGEEPPFLILSFSWYLPEYVDEILAGAVRALTTVDRNRILILCNMDDELVRLRRCLPGYRIALVNNCYALSEQEMRTEPAEKLHDCVYNARPASFKNHHLTTGLRSIVNIAYGAAFQQQMDDFVDISAFNDGPIIWDAPRAEVRRILNESRCGIMLSNVEGCCFASAEYLACGLPVVSTASLGGRDAYYDETNSVLVGNTPAEVRDGVALAVARLESGAFDPAQVRGSFIRRQDAERRALAIAIGDMTGLAADRVYDHLCAMIHADSKLTTHINRYVTGVERL